MTGRRSYSDAKRGQVRQAFIDAGRRLLNGPPSAALSLRRVAAEAGYSPALIYQYFADQRALWAAVRERDMNAATDAMEAAAAQVDDPAQRVRTVILTAARYWLDHPDHFDVLFSGAPGRAPIEAADGLPFGRSDSVVRSLALYTRIVDAYLAALPRRPLATAAAVDTLIAAAHGTIAFPRATSSMNWTATEPMVETVVDALLEHWARLA